MKCLTRDQEIWLQGRGFTNDQIQKTDDMATRIKRSNVGNWEALVDFLITDGPPVFGWMSRIFPEVEMNGL